MAGRPPTDVMVRIGNRLGFDVSRYEGRPESVPTEIRDTHWIWPDLPAPKRKQVISGTKFAMVEGYVMPARIRVDGKLQSVSRILHQKIRGFDYLSTLGRAYDGCDYHCVNPFHLAQPKDDIQLKVPESLTDEDHFTVINGLIEEILDFMVIHGRDQNSIYDHFSLDYSKDEIEEALRRV